MVSKKICSLEKLFLGFVFLLSLALRLASQPKYPSCLHRDEVQFGYNAYSILKTARDEWGQFLPLHFKYNGEYHVPIVFYLISLAMFFVGPVDLSIRLPTILMGSFIPILGFYFAKEITNNKKIGWITAVLLAFNPWQVMNSRGSGQLVIEALFFGLIGFLCLFKFLREEKKTFLIIAVFNFILAYFSYIAARLDIPLLLLVFLLIFHKKIPAKKLSISLIFLTIILPFCLVAIYPKRFVATSLIAQKFFPEGEAGIAYATPFFSQAKNLFFDFTDNYFDYISPYYIFRNMGEPLRTNIPESGSLYLVEIVTLTLGFYAFVKSRDIEKQRKKFVLLAIILSPVVGALTYNQPDRPNTNRTVYFYFLLCFISAYGLFSVFQYLRKKRWQKIYLGVIISLYLLNLLFVAKQLVVYSPAKLAQGRNCGYAELFDLTESLKQDYRAIFIGTEYEYPYVYYLWQTKYSPKKYHQFLKESPPENEPVLLHTLPKRDWTLENYVFKHKWCLLNKQEGVLLVGNFNACKEKHKTRVYKDEKSDRLLFVSSIDSEEIVFLNIAEIKRYDGKTVFNIYKYEKKEDTKIGEDEREHFVVFDN